MYIINLTYKVPLTTVDTHLEAHVEFLNQQYSLGNFLMSGRKEPRNGGIIITPLTNREQLLKIIDQDPFKIHGLADYELIEFIPSKTSKELEFLLGT